MDFPSQYTGANSVSTSPSPLRRIDLRDQLTPRRLTMAMWDQAYVMRHIPGGSFADYDRVLDEAVERGYNTLRVDPMPQWVDLSRPERILNWGDPQKRYMPWLWNTAVDGPVGAWIIEFMEKLLRRPSLHYTLSAWWMNWQPCPPWLRQPANHLEGAEMWIKLLTDWKRRFGFNHLLFVDLANEVPCFFPGFSERLKKAYGEHCWDTPRFSSEVIAMVSTELNDAIALLQREFPELRFTCSIHGDQRWLDIPLEFDCLDVHFYADADRRWVNRTRFGDFMPQLFDTDGFHQEFSDRCMATHHSMAPMLRARQRHKLGLFASWAAERGMPLTTSESWASWFYIDGPHMNWQWLLEWAEWSVEDAIDAGMWGWTPHNYLEPHMENWKDVRWHRRLTQKFLQS